MPATALVPAPLSVGVSVEKAAAVAITFVSEQALSLYALNVCEVPEARPVTAAVAVPAATEVQVEPDWLPL